VERIDLREVEHKVHRWWVKGEPGHRDHAVIGLGQLVNGRWFAARAGKGWAGVWAAHSERQACEAVDSWMRRRGGSQAWREIKPGEPVGAGRV
jgi:hypothetical protein